MPTITAAEIAIVVTAVLLLYVAPFLLTVIEGARRRRQQLWAPSPFEQAEAPIDEVRVSGTHQLESGTGSALPSVPTQEPVEAWVGVRQPAAGPVATPADDAPAEPTPPASNVSAPPAVHVSVGREPSQTPAAHADEVAPPAAVEVAPPTPPVRYAGYEPPVATPFHASKGYRFRLEDLHRARLADWPPDSVHSDPAHQQLWTEAERLAAAHDAVISAADLVAPCPIRSVCLGGCERGPSHTSLHYLLFPDLWPASPEQAVARVVFAIDSASGAIAHSVDALQPSA